MQWESTLTKMTTYLEDEVHYLFHADVDFLHLNPLLGRKVALKFLKKKYCQACGRQFSDLFRMGFCKNCFFTVPQAGESIIHPEKSQAHLGIADRELDYERGYQLQPHVVYLAISGDLKVGVTRMNQRFTRWADQGATQAVLLAETENRFQAGQIEVALKQHIGDKTPWRKMLQYQDTEVDLLAQRERLGSLLEEQWQPFLSQHPDIVHLSYPHEGVPEKVVSINLDKDPEIEGALTAIRGQYLVFDHKHVFNVRRHTGFRISISIA